MILKSKLTTFLLAVLMSSITSDAAAIFIRHDRDDAQYQELAKNYSRSVVYFDGCVGTLIAPKWIITAKHCFASFSFSDNEPLAIKSKFWTIKHLDRQYTVNKVVPHPTDDIALINLRETVDNFTPIELYAKNDERGQKVTFVGNGGFGNGQEGKLGFDGVKRGATNIVEDRDRNWLFFRFDPPIQALDLEGISGEGDSGGPAFIQQGDRLFLAGVSSGQKGGKFGTYGVREYYARISTNLEWIENVIEQPLKQIDVKVLCAKFPLNSRCTERGEPDLKF